MYNINPSIDYKIKELIINKQKIILLYNDILVNKEMINKEILSKIKELSKKRIQNLDKFILFLFANLLISSLFINFIYSKISFFIRSPVYYM